MRYKQSKKKCPVCGGNVVLKPSKRGRRKQICSGCGLPIRKCVCTNEEIFKEVEKTSYMEVAKKYNIPYQKLISLCKKRGIKSSRRHAPKGKSIDDKIFSLLREHGALSAGEIERKLGNKDLNRRLRRLIAEGKINVVRLPLMLHFRKYYDTNLYYIDRTGWEKWANKQTQHLPPSERLAVFLKLMQAAGYKVSNRFQAVNIREDLYNRLKRIARKRDIPLRILVEEMLLEKLEEMGG